jgi:hypothetical protein
MKPPTIEQALSNEFGAYWHGDELPPRSNEKFYEQNARQAAIRLRQAVGANQLASLKSYLEAIRNDPAHPFLAELVNTTGVGWMDEPERWSLFQRVVDLIVQSL